MLITTFRLIDNIYQLRVFVVNIDGKQVDFNDMIIVIVKCVNYDWMNGSESD